MYRYSVQTHAQTPYIDILILILYDDYKNIIYVRLCVCVCLRVV